MDSTTAAGALLMRNLQKTCQAVASNLDINERSEAVYKTRWLAQVGDASHRSNREAAAEDLAALDMSLRGGAIADCLSHVFIGGYQGAMRHVMPQIPSAQWFSFLVSEDKQDPAANPPTQLLATEAGLNINGTKSWVASSAQVDGLVVSAADSAGQTQFFWCLATDSGVSLTHRPAPSFLPDVSQGFARFENLQVPKNQLLPAQAFSHFMHAESLYVGLALAGYLWRHWQQQEDLAIALEAKREPARSFVVAFAAALSEASALASRPDKVLPLALLQGWQLRIAGLLDQFEGRWLGSEADPAATAFAGTQWAQGWWRDHRFTFMYAPMIRSQFAKTTLQNLHG